MKPVRTYQRRRDFASGPGEEPAVAVQSVLQDRTNALPLLPLATGKKAATTATKPLLPPLTTTTTRVPAKSFLVQFHKGQAEDREHVAADWLASGPRARGYDEDDEDKDSTDQHRVPGEWRLERQMRFGGWCQLMGLRCAWEGGYLMVYLTNSNWENLVYAAASSGDHHTVSDDPQQQLDTSTSSTEEEEENSVTQLGRALTHTRISFIAPAPPATTRASMVSKRNRQRTWQDQDNNNNQQQQQQRRLTTTTTTRASITAGGRMSSVLHHRQSLARPSLSQQQQQHRTSLLLLDGRMSVVARKSLFVPAAAALIEEEEEDEEEDEEEVVHSAQPPQQQQPDDATVVLTALPPAVLFNILDYIAVDQVLGTLTSVCKAWSTVCVRYANLYFASRPQAVLSSAASQAYLAQHAHAATFLGEGAYKSVYSVKTTNNKRREAVSVMNMDSVAEDVVGREVAVSLLLSELVADGVCPNFIHTKRVFQLDSSPSSMWRDGEGVTDEQQPPGRFQYISMELCELGDVEEYMKTLPAGILSLEATRSVVFQMCFSLFAARTTAKMRHYDVKCLNFFCCKVEEEAATGPLRFMTGEGEDGAMVFESTAGLLVKLADYGTADLEPHTLGRPIQLAHFTTLENTPIEFLLFPDAVQSYAADVFQLGLSVLHVLTGGLPYEEMMATVKCPLAVREEVSKVWQSRAFGVLQCVLDEDEEDVMYHTLYRYVVLFGLGGGGVQQHQQQQRRVRFHPARSKVLASVRSVLLLQQQQQNSVSSKKAKQARRQYEEDVRMFSFVGEGTHHLVARARERAKKLGMFSLLVGGGGRRDGGEEEGAGQGGGGGLLDFCPETRLTAKQAVQSRECFPSSRASTGSAAFFGAELFAMDHQQRLEDGEEDVL